MPRAARQGDPGVVHCSTYTIANGSPDVFINNRAAARRGDRSTVHLRPGGRACVPHTASITGGSTSVYINGQAAARKGDALAACTSIADGSPDVNIG
jgi:uncharacterized Zn-binding protein involved in type VI secretion